MIALAWSTKNKQVQNKTRKLHRREQAGRGKERTDVNDWQSGFHGLKLQEQSKRTEFHNTEFDTCI